MKKSASIFLTLLLLVLSVSVGTAEAARYSSYDFRTNANEIVSWKKSKAGTGKCLFTQEYMSKSASNADGDWYAVYMGRFGFEDYPDNYLNAMTNYVIDKYNASGTLSDKYATDYHRIALAIKSAGGDPQNVGGINLIADGVYNRGYTASLGKQGMNGWVWGLIALDSIGVQIPDGSYYSREDIISEILKYQLKDGGFSVLPTATKSDVDTTAMALYALAPYQYDSLEYTYKQNATRKTVTKTVGQVVNEAVLFLSDAQLQDGGYSSFGTVNSESVSQVIMALCSLGIDPQSDSRFVKDRSAVDALLSFKQSDGGFAHVIGDGSNAMASEQALGAMAALERFYNGVARLFDFTDGVTMTTFTPQTPNEKPTIPVPENPNKNGNTNTNNNTGTASNSGNGSGSSHTSGASNSNTSGGATPTSSATPNTVSSSSNTSSTAVGGSSGSSVTATEKPTEKTTDKNNSNGSETATASDGAIINAENSGDNSSSPNQVSSAIAENDGGSAINPLIFVIPAIILIAAFAGFCIHKKKKGLLNQNPEDDSSDMHNKDGENQETDSEQKSDVDTEKQNNDNGAEEQSDFDEDSSDDDSPNVQFDVPDTGLVLESEEEKTE